MLAQDFHADGALAGNHMRIVERVHERQLEFLFQRQRVVVGIGVRVAEQHDFAAASPNRVHLDLRRGGRHHDHCAAAELGRRQRQPLRMVACGSANHAALELGRGQAGHLVVSAAQFETEHALHIFTLEINLVANALRQGRRKFKWGLNRDIVDAGGEDFLQIVCGHVVVKLWLSSALPAWSENSQKRGRQQDQAERNSGSL